MLHDERTRDRVVRLFRWAMPFEICYEPVSFMSLSERLIYRSLSYKSLESPKERL